MSQVWIRGPVCGVDNCTSKLYRSADGLKICQYGHVMEGNIEINDDQDDNFIQTKRLNIQLTGVGGDFLSQLSQKKIIHDVTGKLYGEDAREQYLLCLQVILQRQIKILWKTVFPASGDDTQLLETSFENVVKLLWVRLLSHHFDSSTETASEAAKPVSFGNSKLPTSIDLIGILYFATLHLRIPVYAHDFLRAIHKNTIPYMKSAYLVPRNLLSRLPVHYLKLLEPQKLPKENNFYEALLKIYVALNLHTIPLHSLDSIHVSHYYPLVFKLYSKVLMIPNAPEVFLLWSKMVDKIDLNPEFPTSKAKASSKAAKPITKFPEISIVGSSIVAFKLYLIHLNQGRNLKDRRFDPLTWLDNLMQLEMENEFPVPSTDKSDQEDVLNWSDAKIDRYCRWVYSNLIPKKNKTLSMGDEEEDGKIYEKEELSIMDKRLFQIFDLNANDVENLGSRKLDTLSNEALTQEKAYRANRAFVTKLLVKELGIIDGYLIDRMANEFGVTKRVIEGCCLNIEGLLLASQKV